MKYIKLFESMMWERLYHGNRKGDFPPERKRFGAIFLTANLNFAKNFAGYDERAIFPNGAVFEVELKPGIRIIDIFTFQKAFSKPFFFLLSFPYNF